MVAPRALIASLAVVGFSSVLVAQAPAPALDLKVGLWEHTIVTSMSGVPPVDTSKMSPEQAARAAEAMKAMGNDKSVTTKTCLQKEDLAKDSFMMPNSANMTCTRKVTANTSTQFAADITCTGQASLKGHVTIDASPGGSAFTGVMKMDSTTPGRPSGVSIKMSGKYLAADCGAAK